MPSNLSDIGYTKHIEMAIVSEPQLPMTATKLYNLPLKHHRWVQKQFKDL